MLDSLQIKNFRVFQDLRLERLGRVNLIVGKNNSGKTCLLEALRVYGHNGQPLLLQELVRARNEDLDGLADDDSAGPDDNHSDFEPRRSLLHPFRNLFHGYQFPSDFQQAIEIGPVEGKLSIRLSLRAYIYDRNDRGTPAGVIPSDIASWEELASVAKETGLTPDIRLIAELCRDNGVEVVGRHLLAVRDIRKVLNFREAEPMIDVRFVPVKHMEQNETARLWDRVVVRPKLRDHVVKALRLIDPNIQEVVMLQGKRAYSPVPILLYDEETRRPLRSLGDGVSHLFHMILATVSARGGMVLFDEFENGLHWSVQPLVWKTIFELAVDLDLQVFATTHSWDCVQAFKDVAMEHETEAMLFHLGRSARTSDQGKVIVTEYDKESLDLATRAGLEVR